MRSPQSAAETRVNATNTVDPRRDATRLAARRPGSRRRRGYRHRSLALRSALRSALSGTLHTRWRCKRRGSLFNKYNISASVHHFPVQLYGFERTIKAAAENSQKWYTTQVVRCDQGRRATGQRRRPDGAGPHDRCRRHCRLSRPLWRPPESLERGARRVQKTEPVHAWTPRNRRERRPPAHSPCHARPNPARARRARSRARRQRAASEAPTGLPSGAPRAL